MKNIDLLNHSLNFIAVILGVFLAFHVDSCAEKRKEQVELIEIVESVIEDLENDHEVYSNVQIPNNQKQLEDLEKLIADVLNLDGQQDDQVTVNLEVENYNPISSTYLSVKSSGKINLISDLNVKRALSNYYDILSEESIKKGELQVDFFLQQLLPWMVENTDLMNVTSRELRGENTLANRLILYRTLISNKVNGYEEINMASVELRNTLRDFIDM